VNIDENQINAYNTLREKNSRLFELAKIDLVPLRQPSSPKSATELLAQVTDFKSKIQQMTTFQKCWMLIRAGECSLFSAIFFPSICASRLYEIFLSIENLLIMSKNGNVQVGRLGEVTHGERKIKTVANHREPLTLSRLFNVTKQQKEKIDTDDTIGLETRTLLANAKSLQFTGKANNGLFVFKDHEAHEIVIGNLDELGKLCPRLETLTIEDCDLDTLNIRNFLNLKHLDVKTNVPGCFIDVFGCKNLTDVKISGCYSVTIAGIGGEISADSSDEPSSIKLVGALRVNLVNIPSACNVDTSGCPAGMTLIRRDRNSANNKDASVTQISSNTQAIRSKTSTPAVSNTTANLKKKKVSISSANIKKTRALLAKATSLTFTRKADNGLCVLKDQEEHEIVIENLDEIGKWCPQLETLTIEDYDRRDVNIRQFANLKHLVVKSTTATFQVSVCGCGKLESVEVSGYSQVAISVAPKLKRITLAGAKYVELIDVPKDCSIAGREQVLSFRHNNTRISNENIAPK
jgi:hypothetical protein